MEGRNIFIAILFLILGVSRVYGFISSDIAIYEPKDLVIKIISCIVPFLIAAVSVYLEMRYRRKKDK